MSAEFLVGLMSGTSLDGVDAALVAFDAKGPHCLATHYLPYPDEVRREALGLQEAGSDQLRRSLRLANRLADIYAATTNELLARTATPASAIRAIGCHGQTLAHAPAEGYSLQLANPARLVEKTGLTVVADFRSRDIAAGGHGAPLVPAFHDAVFRTPDAHRVIVNIGGIANLTDLAPGVPTRGFDCGPGNMLLDAWAARHTGKPYDEGGRWAREGRVLPALLQRLREHPFFGGSPPKSCGREEFGIGWLESSLAGGESPPDVQATLVALTASTIAEAIERWCGRPTELYVCGGGAHNESLMLELGNMLPGVAVRTTDALGLPTGWVEAAAFAWLAWRTLHGQHGNLPEVTGARGPRVLGAIYPA
jgi:anhydro-N-acetylmuramic acid kinase